MKMIEAHICDHLRKEGKRKGRGMKGGNGLSVVAVYLLNF
jgi:hypothetical protein